MQITKYFALCPFHLLHCFSLGIEAHQLQTPAMRKSNKRNDLEERPDGTYARLASAYLAVPAGCNGMAIKQLLHCTVRTYCFQYCRCYHDYWHTVCAATS